MIPGLWNLTDYVINTVRNAPGFGPTPPIAHPSIDVIWSYQNSARSDKPYIVLDYTTDDLPDHEWYGEVDASGSRQMASWRKATVDMQFYCGPDSMKLANYVAMMFASEAAVDQQQRLNVSIGTRLFLSRMPAMLNASQFEERAIYQFDFYYTETADEWVSWIETVELHGKYSGGASDADGDAGTIFCDEVITIKLDPSPHDEGVS